LKNGSRDQKSNFKNSKSAIKSIVYVKNLAYIWSLLLASVNLVAAQCLNLGTDRNLHIAQFHCVKSHLQSHMGNDIRYSMHMGMFILYALSHTGNDIITYMKDFMCNFQ